MNSNEKLDTNEKSQPCTVVFIQIPIVALAKINIEEIKLKLQQITDYVIIEVVNNVDNK